MHQSSIPRVARPAPVLPKWVTALIVLCGVIEGAIVLLQVTQIFPAARSAATVLGGFWSPLLHGGQGLYPAQSVLMFLTYGLLHGGLAHLAMNMISLAAVARELNRLIGPKQMAMVYVVSQIAAAGLFAIMAPQAGPMVGASGAIFGVAGALVTIAAIRRRQRGMDMSPLWRAVGMIIALNLGLTFLVPSIAWQAHLGGAIAGVIAGIVLARR